MSKIAEFNQCLKQMIAALKEEKQALIESNGEKVAEIVDVKQGFVEKLAEFKGLNIEENKKTMELIKEIDTLQETNLLLTNQALSFQNALLESIAQNVKNSSNTYSAKGNYETSNDVRLVDQSV